MSVSLKHKIYYCCLQLLDDKIQNLQRVLKDLKEGTQNDVKSSAGDKHETAHTMMQLEHEKISRQIGELQMQKNDLEKIDLGWSSPEIIQGSLIKSNNAYFFLSVAIGKINIENIPVIAFSAQSPLGLKMLGHKTGDIVEMNGVKYAIEEVN